MDVPLILRNLFWAVTLLLEIGLLILLLRQGRHRSYPVFLSYILAVILQSIVVAASYRMYGSTSWHSYFIAWGTQSVVISARWIAVIEIAKNALSPYSGIWALAQRILLVVSLGVIAYSLLSSHNKWTLMILTADRAVELCIAAFIVSMLIFLRYYRVPISPMDRLLAVGFCLYSCFSVINDSLYEHWRLKMGQLWNYLGMLPFLATLLVWIDAVWRYSEVSAEEGRVALTPGAYGELSQKLNSQLEALNNRLDHLFRSGDKQP